MDNNEAKFLAEQLKKMRENQKFEDAEEEQLDQVIDLAQIAEDQKKKMASSHYDPFGSVLKIPRLIRPKSNANLLDSNKSTINSAESDKFMRKDRRRSQMTRGIRAHRLESIPEIK